MARHNCRHLFLNEIEIRCKLAVFKSIKINIDYRKLSVRVQACVAMARKMLGSRNDSGSLGARNKGSTKHTGFIRIITKRTGTNNRRIVVCKKIYSRRKVHIDSQRLNFAAYVIGSLPGINRVAASANRHVSRSNGSVALNVTNPAALLVCCNKKRNLKTSLGSLLLQIRNRLCNKVNIISIPAKNFYAAKATLNPLEQKLRRLRTRPAKHKGLREQLGVCHFVGNLGGKLVVRHARPEVYSVVPRGLRPLRPEKRRGRKCGSKK